MRKVRRFSRTFFLDEFKIWIYTLIVEVSTVRVYNIKKRDTAMNFYNMSLLMKYAKEYGHEKIRVVGMSDTEHTICTFLFGHDGVSQDEVADALKLDKTTVARALQTLEEKGFVSRSPNPENRRKNILRLTTDGKESISEVVDIYDRWFAKISSVLSAEEQAQFDHCCSRLLSEAKKICEE